MRERLRILVLYDESQTAAGCNWDHLQALASSRHDVYFQSGTSPALLDLRPYDAVVVHHTIHTSLPIPGGAEHISPMVESALAAFDGGKILFVQDDYEGTEVTRKRMDRIGFDVIYTIIPSFEDARTVYPPNRFPHMKVVPVLAGYAPPGPQAPTKPIADRACRIAYRGRPLPFQYGDLGQEKIEIGRHMKAACLARGVPHDIAWDEGSRIYGGAWHDFLTSARATLVTESGSNVFDPDWSLRLSVERLLEQKPATTYDEARDLLLIHDSGIKMNQISAKVFEAIALRTVIIAFPGGYSGVLKPEHYIRLDKDFANVDEVFRKLEDTGTLQAMVDRAYDDIIASGRWSYDRLTEIFDDDIERVAAIRPRARIDIQPLCLVPPISGARLVAAQLVTNRPLRPEETKREILSTLEGYAIATARAAFKQEGANV